MTDPGPHTADLIARADAALSPNYGRFPVAIAKGKNAELWDVDGKRYIDLFAGFGAPQLGHCHPDLVAAVTEQANTLWHVGNLLHTEPQVRAAEAIRDASGFDGRAFFGHAGADANETAIKLARLYGKAHPGDAPSDLGRYKIVSTTQSFHGRSFATMGATGQPAVRVGFEPLPRGFVNCAYNDIAAVEACLDDETVAIIAEPIQGEGGVNVPDPDYFAQLRELCDDHDLLLICDEVWVGCGRTGKWFGHQHWGVTPDVMTLGKGVGGGLAVGVCVIHPRHTHLFDASKHGVKHATTLGGNCLAMAVTAKLFEVMKRDGLVERAARLGEHIKDRIAPLVAGGVVQEVRGRGLFIGVAIDVSKTHHDSGMALVTGLMDRGVMINATKSGVLRLAPPLTIERDVLDDGLDVLVDALTPA
ncbi:MAG: aminotransferase class III-fold pyridoxal phosphate-dependent enzyme [Planctomycetota bacterium]